MSSTEAIETEADNDVQDDGEIGTTVRAPLKFIGPYPCMSLRFPNLSTESQRSRNVSGISLDFVLDTAANTNTINAQVAKELQCEKVGSALPGMSSAGAITGGDTFMLGDCELEGLGEEPFTFMQNLTASALPVANPGSAGLLSLAFFYCFEGGVEFNWGDVAQQMENDKLKNPPSMTFFGTEDELFEQAISGLSKTTIVPVPVTQLPSVTIKINGIEMPALLDTGSPVTVLNSGAAQLVGIETVALPPPPKSTNNPFATVANRLKESQAAAEAAAKGEIIAIAGVDGKLNNLIRSVSKTDISLLGDDNDVSFGEGHVYVGDIPGLAALNGIGVDSPPAVVLGLDILRMRPRMLLRARNNEVYF